MLKGIEVDILEDGGLDLLDTHCRLAKEEGVLVAINSDAHSELDFDHLRYGIGQGRRGWRRRGMCSISGRSRSCGACVDAPASQAACFKTARLHAVISLAANYLPRLLGSSDSPSYSSKMGDVLCSGSGAPT